MRKILISLVAVFLTGSCVSTINLNPDEVIPYVYCILQNEDLQSLEIHYLMSADGREKGPIDNASAKLYEDGCEVGAFKSEGNGEYTLEYAVIPMKNYRLSIDIPGFETITAETIVPGIYLGNGEALDAWPFANSIKGTRLIDAEDGSNLPKMPRGTSYSIYSTYPYEGAFWFSGMDWNSGKREWEVAEYIASDNPEVDNFNITGKLFDTSDPKVEEFYPTVIGCPEHSRYLRIPTIDTIYANDTTRATMFSLVGNFSGRYTSVSDNLHSPRNGEGYVRAIFANKDYDRYIKDALIYRLNISASDEFLKSFYTKGIYCNILNGAGIFGAMNVVALPWNLIV